jgi:hypothetical protein
MAAIVILQSAIHLEIMSATPQSTHQEQICTHTHSLSLERLQLTSLGYLAELSAHSPAKAGDIPPSSFPIILGLFSHASAIARPSNDILSQQAVQNAQRGHRCRLLSVGSSRIQISAHFAENLSKRYLKGIEKAFRKRI